MKPTTEILQSLIEFGRKNELKTMEISSDIYDDYEVFKIKFRRRL